ncbi:MAG TPA: DUF5719 family protein [Acidimicrobiales bacterium]|nr:DUF5719 family protein [Acidimicrobiales bacterium]
MNSLRRIPLLVVLALALIVVGVLSSEAKSVDPSQLPSALALNGHAESTALYCTGLSSQRLGEDGRVIFLNTTDQSHLVTIDDVSNLGARTSREMTLRPYQQYGFDPSAGLSGDYFGVGAQVIGGGVVGVEVTASHSSEAPCISTGVTNWFASGFDTTVGSSATLSVLNPTATPAVFNVSTFSSSGYVAPAKFQGYAVAPHSQADIDLGTQIVDMRDVGVHVRVLRGTLDIVGLQKSGPTVSFNSGVIAPSTSAIFPLVTTSNNATAQIRFANPGPTPINVRLSVTLAPYHVPIQSLTVAPYGSAVATITPNSAIPAASYASVTVSSNAPVITALATGTGKYVALSSTQPPEPQYLVGDFTGRGFDAATFTNTSSRAISINVTTLPVSRSADLDNVQVHLAADTTESVRSALPALTHLRGLVMIVTASRPTLVVALSLPTRPAGMTVVSALDCR